MKKHDLKVGDTFGNLSFLKHLDEKSNDNHALGLFHCSCGNTTKKQTTRVINGRVKQCNNPVHLKGSNKKHGMRNTKEYLAWQSMKARVLYKNHIGYKNYKHLSIEDSFLHDFMSFYREIGDAPTSEHSVDRIDNTKGYLKGNIRWATRSEQQRNKRKKVYVSIDGITYECAIDAAKKFGVTIQTIRRWCMGYTEKRESKSDYGKTYPPRKNCYLTYFYENTPI